jgi:hypothetical protein
MGSPDIFLDQFHGLKGIKADRVDDILPDGAPLPDLRPPTKSGRVLDLLKIATRIEFKGRIFRQTAITSPVSAIQ